MQDVLEIIGSSKIVLCAGAGGVGKTTTSAAIGLAAAQAGRKTLVLTIDPARRLADALGCTLENEPQKVPSEVLTSSGLALKGELWAAMLDPKKTLDELIGRISPDEDTAQKMLNNLIYRQLSRSAAGALEYTAVEKLFDVRERYDFDLIVVDTPPSQNVIDFLDAPQWLSRFFDERIFKWFAPPKPGGGLARRLMQRTGKLVWDMLARIFGAGFTQDIAEFFAVMSGMAHEIRRRADTIGAVLTSSETTCLVVTSTHDSVIDDAGALRQAMDERGIGFAGFVVNRIEPLSGVPSPLDAVAELRAGISGALDESLALKLQSACEQMDLAAARDLLAVQKLRTQARWQGFLAMLPLEVGSVHDLRALHGLSRHLVAAGL